MISAELPSYASLEENTGFMIPSVDDAQELFAQVFAAVISRDDGTVKYSNEIQNVCPNTTRFVKSQISTYCTNEKESL